MATTPVDPEPADTALIGPASADTLREPAGSRDTAPADDPAPAHDFGGADTAASRDPERRGATSGDGGGALPVAAVVAALWAATISYAAVLGLDRAGRGGFGQWGGRRGPVGRRCLAARPRRTAAVGRGSVTLVPLAISVLAAAAAAGRGSHQPGDREPTGPGRSVRRCLAGRAAGVAYGGVGALAALVARGEDTPYEPWRAFVTLGGFGVVFGMLGAIRAARGGRAPR